MRDISNSELKDTLIDMRDTFKEQTNSLKEFIKDTNINVCKLNDNQVFHNKELEKLNDKLEVYAKLADKLIPKIFWLVGLLVAIILFMSGYSFLFETLF